MAIIDQVINGKFALYNGDCMEVLPGLGKESVDLSVYSPPFPELYQYSNDPRDMSNCKNYEEGMDQYRYIVNEIFRLTKPGRMSCVHCMDLKKGPYWQQDFPGDIVKIHQDAGFGFFCRITIWKDAWLIARRTRLKTLQHKVLVGGSKKYPVRVAGADYILVFQKGGEMKEPIVHPEGLKKYAGEDPPDPLLFKEFEDFTGDQRKNFLSHQIFRKYASPVWMDIRTGRLLPYADARDNEEEKHVCPLQLDVIDRCLTLWSNEGDTILTPFMGVGSEVYGAIKNKRKGIGIELKETYYRQAVRNIEDAATETECDDNNQMEFQFDDSADADDGVMD